MSRTAIRHGRLFLIGGGVAAVAVAMAALKADLMVTQSFSSIGNSSTVRTSFQAATPAAPQTAKVGSEGYWLTRADVESPAAFAKHLTVGDRITVAGQDGRQRILEVVDMRALGEPLAKAVTGAAPPRLLLVTCRVVGAGEGEVGAPVRFIIEGEPSETPPVQRPASQPKAL